MMDLRKIDALVAEKVLGYERGNWVSEDKTRVFTWRDGEKKIVYDDDCLPWFSSSIEAAWDVWEKLREVGTGSERFCCMDIRSPLGKGWDICLRRDGRWEDHEDRHHEGKAFILVSNVETAPLAICIAALKARGVKLWKEEIK